MVWILFLVRFARGFIFVAWEKFEMRPFYQKSWVWKFQRIRLCALLLREILLHQRYSILNLTKSNFCRIGEELPINERQYLFENGTLLLKSVRQSDGGKYSCTVVQGSNSVSQSVTVQVQGNTYILKACLFMTVFWWCHDCTVLGVYFARQYLNLIRKNISCSVPSSKKKPIKVNFYSKVCLILYNHNL